MFCRCTNFSFRGLRNSAGLALLLGALSVLAQCTNFESVPGENFCTGGGDRILGQPTARRFQQLESRMTSPQGVYAQSYTEDGESKVRVFVMDSSHHRIQIWNTMPTTNGAFPDIILANLDARNTAVVTPPDGNTLHYPTQVFVQDDKLYAADNNNHRILVWNKIPTKSAKYSSFEVGAGTDEVFSPDFDIDTVEEVREFKPSLNPTVDPLSGFNYVASVFVKGSKFFAADVDNHRVMIWNNIPTENTPADYQLGTTGTAGATTSLFNKPRGISSDGTRLFVTDTENDRVLVWNTIPTAPTPASYPIQALGASSVGLDNPLSVHSDGTHLLIADELRNRVLIWNTIPTANNTPPDHVLGQTNLTTFTAGRAQDRLDSPSYVYSDNTNIYVADRDNHRVLIFAWADLRSIGTLTPATLVLGQTNFTDNFADGSAESSYWVQQPEINLKSPTSVTIKPGCEANEGYLAVADTMNNRVLVWQGYPSQDGEAPDFVIGQPDKLTTAPSTPSTTTLTRPQGLAFSGETLLIADTNASRIMVYPELTTSDGQPGQAVPLYDGINPTRPQQIFVAGTKIIVSTSSNHVYIYDEEVGATPDIILGDGSVTTPATQSNMNGPYGVWSNGTKLYVVDRLNNRVLIWNTFPTSSGALPDAVLGQADNDWALRGSSLSGFSVPSGIASDGTRLYIAEEGNHRIKYWNVLPSSNVPPDGVIGQEDFDVGGSNTGGLSFDTLSTPKGMFMLNGMLYIADLNNHRVMLRRP